MGYVTEVAREEIRRRVPLEELLPEYNVHLIASGSKWKALCPFHQEKTPSFWVDPDKQLYYCYGCQEGGDLFRFIESMDRVGFSEAVEMLARRAGVVLEEQASGAGRRQQGVVEIYDALDHAARLFQHVLLEDPRAEATRRYLETRGIDREMWGRFRLGFSLDDWSGLLTAAGANGISGEVLERAGLAKRRDGGRGSRSFYDTFRGRLMFPISDAQGRVVGFGARTLEEGPDAGPKYINTPKTALFDKSQVLYAVGQAKAEVRRRREIVIVEGYTDVIAAHQAGLGHFVASLGTAFTRENARQLYRLAPRVTLVFDGDAAGQNATERSLDLLVQEDLDVRVYTVTDGKDPCDAVLALGGQEFQRRLSEESVGIFEFKWRCTVGRVSQDGGNAGPPDGDLTSRGRAVDEFLRLVARVPNAVTRKLILREYAERLGIDERAVLERLEVVRRGFPAGSALAPRPSSRETHGNRDGETGPSGAPALEELAEVVLECLLAMPARAASIWKEAPRELFSGRVGEALVESIEELLSEDSFSGVRLARKLEDPVAHRTTVRLLSRLEGDDGFLADEYQMRWTHCLRDIRRWKLRERLCELDRLVERARTEGDDGQFQALRLERSRLLRESKR
ncbi:MAG: DNA primase [Planctomycetota bacterium]|nr:DNA primase [Planctomycetota bacterium]